MAIQQLIYASQPFGFDAQVLASILATARSHNPRHQITGALICRADVYLQLLEGPGAQVMALYKRIEQDDRHVGARILAQSAEETRLFPDWSMKHDPARSWLWSKDQVHDGAMDSASETEIRNVFAQLAA